MKKVFTLLTLALLSIGSAWADTEVLFDAAGAEWKDYANYASASTTINGVTWHFGSSASLATGDKTFSDGVTWSSRL